MSIPTFDLSKMRRGAIHVHHCACGCYVVCKAEPDKCAIADPYVCDNCSREEQDAYFDRLATMQTQQEPN